MEGDRDHRHHHHRRGTWGGGIIDPVAYRHITSLGRLLVDEGHLTPYGLRMLDAVVIEESGDWEEKQ
jgi:hypothetical protein